MTKLETEFKKKTGLNFKQFYKDQKPKLVWYLTKWTKDLKVSEDFADDAFVKALTSIESYNGEKAQVHTWLYTIAVNYVKKEFQEKQKMPSVSIDKMYDNNSNMTMFLPNIDNRKSHAKYLETCKKAQIIKKEIYNMPEKQIKYRTVLIMREIDNLSYNEISEYLNLNLSTVKSQIKQGREIIKRKVIKKINNIDKHGLV